jgi:hypothetical protein
VKIQLFGPRIVSASIDATDGSVARIEEVSILERDEDAGGFEGEGEVSG